MFSWEARLLVFSQHRPPKYSGLINLANNCNITEAHDSELRMICYVKSIIVYIYCHGLDSRRVDFRDNRARLGIHGEWFPTSLSLSLSLCVLWSPIESRSLLETHRSCLSLTQSPTTRFQSSELRAILEKCFPSNRVIAVSLRCDGCIMRQALWKCSSTKWSSTCATSLRALKSVHFGPRFHDVFIDKYK